MGRWRRVAAKSVVVVSASCVAFDLWNDRVLSRSARTLTAAARVAYAYKFTTPETVEELSNLNRHAAQIMLDTCLANEGLYIKFGQGISALNHVMPPEFVKTMAVCLDRAPVVPFADIKRIIEEETGKTLGECFETFDEKPVASASIAQVHRATIRDSSTGALHEVAVKVQKPKIRRQMWWDLTVHHFVCWALEKTFDMPILWGQKTITETMKKEIDFIQEAANIERCAALFHDRNDLAVPKVYREYLTERLLLTEWIQAPKLADIPTVVEQFDAAAVLQTIVEVFGDMIFRHGFLHADPHPANVLVRRLPSAPVAKNSKSSAKAPHQVVLLDFGLCIEESERFRTEFGRMFNAIFEQDFQALDTIVKGWGIRHSELFASMMVQKPVRRDVHISSDKPLTKEEVAAVQLQMKRQARELLADDKLIPRELLFVGRAMNLVRSLNKSYGAPVNRINILADRARLARGARDATEQASGTVSTLQKDMRVLVTKLTISIVFTVLRWYSAIITFLFGGPSVPLQPIRDGDIDASGRMVSDSAAGRTATRSLEDVIDAQEAKAMTRFHSRPFDINTRD